MGRKKAMLVVLAMVGMLAASPFVWADGKAEEEALVSANAWLSLVDHGAYAESWEQSASYVKGMVKQEELGTDLGGGRRPLGKVISRQVTSKQYATTLPGAPDGEYVVIQYQTSFENKKESVETVTPMREKDGSWKVAGYHIR